MASSYGVGSDASPAGVGVMGHQQQLSPSAAGFAMHSEVPVGGIGVAVEKRNPAFCPFDKCVVINGSVYYLLKRIGRGGSCQVFKVMDNSRNFYALKRVVRSRQNEMLYAKEIDILQKPEVRNHPLIINLREAAVSQEYIYLLLELGSADFKQILDRLWKGLAQRLRTSSDPNESRDYFNQVRVYWHQILRAVHAAHEAGVIHADLKPANFLNVDGQLKLIDFGISRTLAEDDTHIVCDREQIQGSLYYLPPETLDYEPALRKASDVWSLGCILYQMVYGVTPLNNLRFEFALRHLKSKKEIQFPSTLEAYPNLVIPPSVIAVLKRCLVYTPKNRPSIPELLAESFQI